jgi:hypothetical protein
MQSLYHVVLLLLALYAPLNGHFTFTVLLSFLTEATTVPSFTSALQECFADITFSKIGSSTHLPWPLQVVGSQKKLLTQRL